jgi:hypothetical protein
MKSKKNPHLECQMGIFMLFFRGIALAKKVFRATIKGRTGLSLRNSEN